MVLEGSATCLKYLLFAFNFMFWLSGCAILGVAIWLRIDVQTMQYVRVGEDLETFYIGTYVLIAAGALVMLVGFLGCCGAIMESPWLLASFFAFLVLIFSAEVGGGAWAYLHRSKLEDYVREEFQLIVQTRYNQDSYETTTKLWDQLQISLRCCGGEDMTDWNLSFWGSYHPRDVPDSCCVRQERRCGRFGLTKKIGMFRQGCSSKMVTFFSSRLLIIMCVGLGVAILQLMGMVFSLMFCCALRGRRGSEPIDNDSNSKPPAVVV
ncbi:CD9 antigen-like [Branchiostoma floridae x Branchiostoma belcheri]|nr:cd9 antigen [Branchiostoma belcheri]